MAHENKNMDKFLRASLGDLSVNPSQGVWKGVTKRLIILELLRLNFTNIGKAWLYSGLATIATISGLTYFSLTQETEEKPQLAEPTHTEQNTNNTDQKSTIEIVSTAQEDVSASETNSKNRGSEVSEKSESKQKQNEVFVGSETTQLEKTKTTESSKKTKAIPKNEPLVESIDMLPKLVKPISVKTITMPHQKDVSLAGLGRAQMLPYNTFIDADEEEKSSKKNIAGFNWYIGASYNPEWPLSNDDMYVYNHQLAINAGIEFKKWMVNVGLGLRTEKTPSMYSSNFLSYDSIGYFYDIDYYDINPGNQDSITIYYTIENLYDSVAHQTQSHGPDQRRRWMFVPFSLGYQVLTSSKYQLYANVFGQYGWQSYIEESHMNLQLAAGSTIKDITPDANSNYLQIGIGLENNLNVFPQWWIYAEPRINYYINTPYSINQTTGNGPYSFGIKVGVKYKFKRRLR